MLNQTVLVGRLVDDPEIKETENGNVANITLAVSRSYKNDEGRYDTDYIKCTLWNGIATNTAEYCKKGDVVGIKGRLQTNSREDGEGKSQFYLNVIAEKVTFLSSKSKDQVEQDRC